MRAHLLSTIRVAAAALALAGAGCGSSGSGVDADAFAGTWTFQSGTIMPMCSGLTVANIDLTGDPIGITKLDSSHVAMTINAAAVMCNVRFTVTGSTAKADTGQTCAINQGGIAAVVNVTSWTLVLSGTTIDMSMNGTAAVSIVSCAPSATGTMVRSSADAAQSG